MSNISPNAIFWMYNSVYFSFIQIFHGLLVPWMMTIPWKRNKRQSPKQEFYVLKPKQLLPRRYLARKCQSESLVCCVIGQQTLHTEFNTLCSKPNQTSDQVRLFPLNTLRGVPDNCQFWDTTALVSPVKVPQKRRKFALNSQKRSR